MTKEPDTLIESLLRERPRLAGLFVGQDLSLSPNYPGPCAQSSYAQLHLQNAADLLRASYHLDFAVPGALFLLRQGLELWLKCIASNLELDEILAVVVRDRPSFDELSKQDVISRGRSKGVAIRNKNALSRGLCAFRSANVDGLRAPEIWTTRNQGNFPDQSIQAVADLSGFGRDLFGLFYIPLIGGHDLQRLWKVVHEDMSGRVSAINSFGSQCAYDEQMDLGFLDDLVEVISRLDPNGDALRYPFSFRQEWHDRMPPMSRPWLQGAIGTTLSQIVNESGERSQRYALSTIGGGVQSWLLRGLERPGKAEAAPAASAPAKPGKRARRTSADLEGAGSNVLAYVKANPGSRLEEIGRGLGTETGGLKGPIKVLLAAGQLRTEGQKRGTKYFAGSGKAAPAKAKKAGKGKAGKRAKKK